MAPTRSHQAAAGAFDAQAAIERLDAEMTEIRGDITELKQSTSGIADIQQKMVTLDALDAIMQKYLAPPTNSSGNNPSGTEDIPSLLDQRQFPPLSVSIPVAPTVWSAATHVPPIPSQNLQQLHTSIGPSVVTTDSVQCATSLQQAVPPTSMQQSQSTPHFQIPPIIHPPPYTPIHQQFQPNPGIWPSQHLPNQIPTQSPSYNPVIGQYIPVQDTNMQAQQQVNFRGQSPDVDRNDRIQMGGGVSYYADAVLKGPRLEIPLFAGDDPIGWLQQCEKFFSICQALLMSSGLILQLVIFMEEQMSGSRISVYHGKW